MMRSAFDTIDSQRWSIFGFNPLASLWNVGMWRKYFAVCVVVATSAWAIFGWDSTWSQLKPFGENLIFLLNGETTFREIWMQSRYYYGIGNHFSAPVIYGLSFIFLSFYLEKQLMIKKSLNFFISTALSLFNIGIFEWLWNYLYATFQHQPWVITFRWKQVSNLVMFTLFIFIGLLTFLYLYAEGYKPNLNHRTFVLIASAVLCWNLWVNYPFRTNAIMVETTEGFWMNSAKFPQTYYNVDTAPEDKIAIGTPYFVENNLIHFVNLLAKILTTLSILSLSMVKPLSSFMINYDKEEALT